jgi:dipeptidyl aminopeptidase/acylaminoacyl peptidase
MVSTRCAGLAVLAGAAIAVASPPARAACTDPASLAAPGAALTARDLIELNEIGFPDGSISDPTAPVAVDPSGMRIAFVVVRADLASNGYCHTLMVMDLAGGAPRVVARGGDYAPQRAEVRGLFATFGTPLVVAPVWSPDGRWIAWLRRDAGITQVWVAAADGSGARALTRSASDVEEVRWDASGRVLFSTRPAAIRVNAAVDRESESGWLYDDRITPNAGPRPQLVAASVPLEWFALPLDGVAPQAIATPALPVAVNDAGDALTIERSGSMPFAEARVTWRSARGAVRPCPGAACRGRIVKAWWQPGAATAWFLRREGFKRETSALYRWRAGAAPERMLASTDVINWCTPAARGLICLREASAVPRRIVLVDWMTGAPRTLYDPNPAFARFRLGAVTRLRWRNDRGLEAWGDLVLPPDYRAGDKLALVVTQYTSRGFLRGGTGNEYPIFLFAQRGIAVLSLERPDAVAMLDPSIASAEAGNRANMAGWADRRSVQSSIATGVRAAIATGAIDPGKIGITGLSDGATAVRFALINSKLFAAAALSSCCIEPDTLASAGPAFARIERDWGAPIYGAPGDAFWRPVSLVLNAGRIDTPLLMQLSDDEYSLALGAFEALRVRGKPVEMYVFPDEHHNKALPRHRLAIFERSLDWFDFWLRGREDPDPAKHEQYDRWKALRATR